MLGLAAILLRYGSRLPQTVYNHVLNDLIDLSPGLGSVETLSYGASEGAKVAACTAAAASCGPFALFCGAGCYAGVSAEQIQVPETENHITMIYVLQYLKNQILFDRTNNPSYDNSQNGYRTALLNRLKGFVRNDFVEYNAHDYQDYEMYPLLNLFSYAEDPAVKAAAKLVLDYISAKVAASSDGGRRSTPFRRHNDTPGGYFCDELLLRQCSDPQTAWYMMLAGVTDILQDNSSQDWSLLGSPQGAPDPHGDALSNYGVLSNNQAPDTLSFTFQLAGSDSYAIDPLIEDLFTNPADQTYYQFIHYTSTQRLSGSTNVNDELYFRSPSYLISAGGHPSDYAYAADFPFPISLIVDALGVVGVNLISKSDDLGVAVPTTLMPTAALHSRAQLIRFYDPSGENLCVWRNFACGLNPVIPANYQPADPGTISTPPPGSGSWLFFDKSGGSLGTNPGYYAAVYQQGGFGFFEVYDTLSNPNSLVSLNDFANKVFANNNGRTFSQTDPNTWKVIAGNVIQFTVDAHIVSVDGNPPYDPNRTNGDIINNDGTGVVTITNPFTGKSLTLDASNPTGHPAITVPGPLNFPDTCVGATSTATLNGCNTGTGTDNLFVYNILSNNTQFQVTEPTAGYPTTISPDFCFPFQAQFTPKVTGAVSGTLTISNSDPNAPELKLGVSGNGIQQSIATTISNGGNFGNVCPGGQASLSLNVTNQGGCSLVISNVTSSSGLFLPPTMTLPLTLSPDATISLPITFRPGASQACSNSTPLAGTVTIASNDPVYPNLTVNVSGTVPCPSLNATIANTGSFGNVCAGTQQDMNLQIINQGQCNLNISGIASASTATYDNFVLPAGTTYPLVLSPDADVNVPIRFQPPAYGSPNYVTCSSTSPQTATVTITSDDPNHPNYVTAVSGIEGCPKLVLSPQKLNGTFAFPATVSDPTGTLGCYSDRQITMSNAGICPLTVLSGNLSASPSNYFSVVNPTTPLNIAPGAAPVPITVRFRPISLTGQNPTAPDQQQGSLSIISNDPVAADDTAGGADGLCGEPVYHSGARVLVIDSLSNPIGSVSKITLASKGLKPAISQTLMPAPLLVAPNICGSTIYYHLDNETLKPAGTTGNSPLASYVLSAKSGPTSANMSFTLGQCQMQQIILQIK